MWDLPRRGTPARRFEPFAGRLRLTAQGAEGCLRRPFENRFQSGISVMQSTTSNRFFLLIALGFAVTIVIVVTMAVSTIAAYPAGI